MNRNYRKEHEIACEALSVSKERADQDYDMPPKTILFKKVQNNGELRVGYKDYSSGDNFRLISMKYVKSKGIDIDSLPEYTEFSKEYYYLQSKVNEFFRSARQQSKDVMRRAKSECLKRFYEERREIYDSYMASPEWASKRQECYQVHGTTCVDCMSQRGTDIHHLHYNTLGDEDPTVDIVPLCSNCHRLRHENGDLTKRADPC